MVLVVVPGRPLDIDAGALGVQQTVRQFHFEDGRIEEIIESGRGEWLLGPEQVTYRDQCRPVDRSSERVGLPRV